MGSSRFLFDILSMMRKEDLLNKKFGRLLVTSLADNIKNRAAWMCQCDCGNIKIIKSENLKNGSTKSCGCLNNEKRKERSHNLYSSVIKYHPRITTARRIWRNRYNDGIEFLDFYHMSQLNCYYCNSPPNNIQNSAKEDKKSSEFAKNNGDFKYNGLDRIDNSKSHSKDNCVPCCKWCNYAKRERSAEDFILWIKTVYKTICTKSD